MVLLILMLISLLTRAVRGYNSLTGLNLQLALAIEMTTSGLVLQGLLKQTGITELIASLVAVAVMLFVYGPRIMGK